MIDGLVVVDKPGGFTSHDVVARLRRAYGQKRVGHAGTLDPAATGVLVVGLGRVTRLLRFLQETRKEYRGRVVFGIATDTLDAEGSVLEQAPMSLERAQVETAAGKLTGDIEQLPPMVSAVKVGGQKLYEAARRGEEVERSLRPVTVHRLDVEEFSPGAYPEAVISVECSSGTYIRALAADLGTALGGCAHLAELRRTRVGPFSIDASSPLEAIEADPPAAVLEPVDALPHLELVQVDDEQARAVGHGVVFPPPALLGSSAASPGPFRIVGPDGRLLAVYELVGAACRPAVVLV